MELKFPFSFGWRSHVSKLTFRPGTLTKTLLIMKLTAIIILATCLQVSAKGFSQQITLKVKNVSLEVALSEIGKQSGYQFFFNERLLEKAKKISVQLEGATIEQTLDACFKDQPFDYAIVKTTIVITKKEAAAPAKELNGPPVDIIGVILDEKGNPLAGATIRVVGTNKTAVSNDKGEYSITANKGEKLEFSFVSYATEVITVGSQTSIKTILKIDAQGLQETVVVGYGTQRKANLTSAMSTMKAKDIALIPTSNLSNVLAGRLSGTYIQTNTGTPGISSSIRVRANSTFNSDASTEPVYVIDGVVRDKTSFDALDPNEVDEISVLKDAASAAIYGSRSSNGVLLVTTKTGKSGKAQISYSTTFSTQKTGRVPEYLDLTTSLALNRYVFGENNITSAEEADVRSWNADGKAWYNAAYQDPNNQRHALSISGGTDKVTYYLGGSFFNENGFLPNVWYKKYNLRGNVSVKVTRDLTVGLNLSNNYGTRNRFNFTYDYGSADLNNLWGKLFYNGFSTRPYVNGNPVNPGWLGNQIEMMRNGGYWRNNNQQVDALVTAEYKIHYVPGLSVKASFSKNFDNSSTKNFAKKQLLYNYQMTANGVVDTSKLNGTVLSGDPGTEYIGNEYTKTNSYQLNGQINYDKSFGKHHINALAAYEQYEYNYSFFSTYRYNFPLFPTDQFFAASGNSSDWTNSANESQDGRLSYIGRLNYEYADKYLFSASVRRDGSIRFAPDKRWGWFPSVAAGWKISEENFFKNAEGLRKAIDMMKIRLSYAATGNDAIANSWAWQDQYNIQSSSYYIGTNGTTNPRLSYGGIPNPNLTWEKSNSLNLGFDFRFLKNFSFTAEFWKRHTYDILGARVLAIPAEFGANLPSTNYGVVNAKGLEIELGYSNQVGKNFFYSIKGNFGLATNKVILKDVAAGAIPVDDPNGKTLNYVTGFESTGIYRTQADLDKLPSGFTILGQAPVLGMLSFADVNGPSGAPDGKVDNYDRVKLANYSLGQAPVSYGLNLSFEYKGFSVNALFAGLAGFKIFYNDAFSRNVGSYFTYTKFWEDYWTETNTDAKAPKPFSWGDSRATYANNSSYNLYDGSFVRMKYLSLGYRIPEKLTQKAGINNVQIFASGTNLFVLSKFKYYDPEVSQFMSYPIMKTFSLGFNINL
jgi:TonB-linked SusC/RagA family outer membrane protein